MNIPGKGNGGAENMERLEDHQRASDEPMYSSCCYVRLWHYPDNDYCPKCKEHCEAIDEVQSEFERGGGMDRF